MTAVPLCSSIGFVDLGKGNVAPPEGGNSCCFPGSWFMARWGFSWKLSWSNFTGEITFMWNGFARSEMQLYYKSDCLSFSAIKIQQNSATLHPLSQNACSAYIIQFLLFFFPFLIYNWPSTSLLLFVPHMSKQMFSPHVTSERGVWVWGPPSAVRLTTVLALHTSLDACIIHALSLLRRTHKIFVNL